MAQKTPKVARPTPLPKKSVGRPDYDDWLERVMQKPTGKTERGGDN